MQPATVRLRGFVPMPLYVGVWTNASRSTSANAPPASRSEARRYPSAVDGPDVLESELLPERARDDHALHPALEGTTSQARSPSGMRLTTRPITAFVCGYLGSRRKRLKSRLMAPTFGEISIPVVVQHHDDPVTEMADLG